MTTQELTEAEKVQRVPGIIFADGPAGRRARVAGTGIDVFEVIKGYHVMDDDWSRLTKAYHWLRRAQLRAGLKFYAEFPEEIDARLAKENELTPEVLRARFPGRSF